MGFLQIFKIILSAGFLFILGCQTSEKDKEKADLHLQLGNTYLESAAYPQALTELLQAEKLNPKNPFIQNSLGLTYFRREKYDLSELHFKNALKINPKYTDCRNNLAQLYIDRKNYKEAQAQLDIVLDDLTYVNQDLAFINQGLLYFNQGRFVEAEKFFSKTISLQRENCLAHNYLGRSVFEQADYSRAISLFNRAAIFCQKVRVDEPNYYNALSHYRNGDKAGSIAKFEELIRLYPNGKYTAKSKEMIDLLRKGVE